MTVRFIRHGESAANAGFTSSDPALIPLTNKGMQEAVAVSKSLQEAPDLITKSPFLRARHTAEPTIQRFIDSRIEVWPIQELTYLSPAKCAATNAAQRRPLVDAYWQLADPTSVDGPSAESFKAFIKRVRSAFSRLEKLGYGFVVVFAMVNSCKRHDG